MDSSNPETVFRETNSSTSIPAGSKARQRYQRGSVSLRGEVWYGKYREDVVGLDGKIKRVQRSPRLGTKKEYPTKHLAERVMEQILSRVNMPQYRPGRVATVVDFAERWKLDVLSRRKPSQRVSASSNLNFHIVPYFGNARLDAIGVESQQNFVTYLTNRQIYKGESPLSSKTIFNVLGILSSMLNTAKKWGYICEGVSLNKLALPERDIAREARSFTVSEVQQILAAAEHPYRLMYGIAGLAGLRAGEIMALRVCDVDLQKCILHVRQTAWYSKIQTTKNKASETDLPIPSALADMFKEYFLEWKPNPANLLFANRRGHPAIAETIVKKRLHPLLDRLKIPRNGKCGFHAFRHMHASVLLESGASPKVAQRQLRHSDARITLGIYAHIVEGSHRRAVERMCEIVVPRNSGKTLDESRDFASDTIEHGF